MASNQVDSTVVSLETAFRYGRNIVTETFNPVHGSATVTLSTLTGQIRAALMPVIENDVISSLSSFVTSIGTGVTDFRYALYDRNFNKLVETGNIFGSLATGYFTGNLQTPYKAPSSGVLYAGLFSIAGTTQPTVASSPVNFTTGSGDGFPGTLRLSWLVSAVALPAIATPTQSNTSPYIVAT